MANGAGGQIAISRTGSLNMPSTNVDTMGGLSGWRWTNFVSESIKHNLEQLEEGSITGRRGAPPSYKGLDFGEGEIELEPNPNAFGEYLHLALGTRTTSQVCAAGSTGANSSGVGAGRSVHWHEFTPRETNFDERTFLEPGAVMVYKDTGSAFYFNGAVVNGLEINVVAKELLSAKASLMARDVVLLARTAAITSLVSSGGRPWVWDTVSVQVGPGPSSLAAHNAFEGLKIGVEVPLEGVALLDGTKKYGEMQQNDFRRTTLEGNLSFRNLDEYLAFTAYESRYLRITATNVNSNLLLGNPSSAFYFQLQIDIPNFKIVEYDAPIGGPSRITASFQGKAEMSDVGTAEIIVRLTNTTSFY